MKKNYILFIAATLDGYIATQDHDLNWLMNVEGEGDNGYQAFYDTVDAVVMGRSTYDWIDHHIPNYPYPDVTSYIVTSHPLNNEDMIAIDNVDLLLKTIEASEASNIWIIGGGQLITELIQRNIIDTLRVTIAPILLGKGIRLFNEIDHMVELELLKTTRYNQFVELYYKVK